MMATVANIICNCNEIIICKYKYFESFTDYLLFKEAVVLSIKQSGQSANRLKSIASPII